MITIRFVGCYTSCCVETSVSVQSRYRFRKLQLGLYRSLEVLCVCRRRVDTLPRDITRTTFKQEE